MPISYKFIAVQVSSKINLTMEHQDEIIDGYIDYNIIKNYFLNISINSSLTNETKSNELNDDDITNIKFIFNNQNMSLNEEEKYIIDDNEIKVIYIVTVDNQTKFKLLNIFNKYGYNPNETNKCSIEDTLIPDTPDQTVSNDSCFTDEIIQKSNEETIKLFKNKDFNTLLQIYKNNSNIFNIFSSYISNGDVIINCESSVFNELPRCDLSVPSESINESFEQIKSLDLLIPDQHIIDALKINNGHMNLTLRYLLYNLDN
jgi:hypothetical protein